MEGDSSVTSIVTIVVALPPVFVAVTVYAAEEVTAVGVPEIAPFDVENNRPAGNAGEMDQDSTGPPREVGITVGINVFFSKEKEFGV